MTEQYNILHLEELGAGLAEKVLEYWMQNIHRQLTNFQWRVAMNAMHKCSLALFLDLCFSLMKTWKSYDPPGKHKTFRLYFASGTAMSHTVPQWTHANL